MDRHGRFVASRQGCAPTTVGEGDEEFAVLRFDGCLIHFVRRALSEIERDALHVISPFLVVG